MLTNILIALIRVYQQTLSRLLLAAFGPVCRFEPSCSRYAVACLQGHGALRGTLLSVKRLCKCHPFHPGGFDPPPPPRHGRAPAPVTDDPARDSTQRDARSDRIGARRQAPALAEEPATQRFFDADEAGASRMRQSV